MDNRDMTEPSSKDDLAARAVLVISQVYVPDPASVGQHMHDAAAEMVERGFEVVVYSSATGYDDPTIQYPKEELLDGVKIRRFRFSSFGKHSIAIRILAQIMFLLQVIWHGLFLKNMQTILVSTSPPFAGITAVILKKLKGVKIVFWSMDVNPDQMIILGVISESSLFAKAFQLMNTSLLRNATSVIALDKYMAKRLNDKYPVSDRMIISPPWPHDNHLEPIDHSVNPFRKEHDLEEKFVLMFSGNHGLSNPIRTLLEAAKLLRNRQDLVFMFIGGGVQKQEVEEVIQAGYTNVRSLPYQPLEILKYSLSAADVHVVTIGNEIVGICHPCKIYGAMTVGRPVLYFGPQPSHVSEIICDFQIGWHIPHGNVERAVSVIEEASSMAPHQLREMGTRAQMAISNHLSKAILCGNLCNILEQSTIDQKN